jgi:hydroxypyruvate isomerase
MNRREFSKALAGASGLAGAALAQATSAGEHQEPAPYQISVMLWTVFKNLAVPERLEKVAEAGYQNIELIGEYKKWSDAGLKHGVADPDHREALLADVRGELPIMEEIECPAVIIMSGNVIPGMPRERQRESCIEGLKRAAALVEGKQINGQPVRLLLENIDPEENPKYYLTSVAEGFEIVRAVNHPQVRLLYDFYHEQISEGNLIEKLEKNIEYTGLVHIADVPGRHAPGTGEIHYENIYRKLAKLKYDRMVAMEFLPLGDAVAELRTAREQALHFGRA